MSDLSPHLSVYLIKSEDGFYKIGLAKNLPDRIKTLQEGNPHSLSLLSWATLHNAYALEIDLHKRYRHRLVRGEWFSLTSYEASEIVGTLNAVMNWTLWPELPQEMRNAIEDLYEKGKVYHER